MLEVLGERLEPGVVVGGAYRLERIVGEGGMGVVWAAREIATGKLVALKFLRDGADGDPKQRERFMREARAVMAVVHPHVAKVDAVLETDVGVPYLVMELLQGESMREMLTRRRRLAPVETARLLLPVIDAVSAAHAARIVHRDLKPENIFLVKGTDVRVLDFGIAKRLPASADATGTAITTTGALMGTPVYMAPEQIFGEEVDPSADVWALGIILYECIAGARPTDADGFGPIIKRITAEPIAGLEHVVPSTPPVLARLVARMLTRDRTARPTLTEVRATLAQVAESKSITIDEPAPHTRRIGPSPTAPTAPAPAPPKPKGLLQQNAVPIAIAVAIAFVILIVATTAAIGTAFVHRDKILDAPAPVTSNDDIKKRTDASHVLMDEARAAMERRDGKTCLAKLDRYDEIAMFKSNTPGSLYGDVRAKCLLLAGRCPEGKIVMREWLQKNNISTTPLEDRLEVLVGESCESEELTPREAIFRAHWRLKSMRSPTPAQCDEWMATLDRLLKENPSRGLLDKTYADVVADRPSLLGECRARAK